MDWLDVPQMWLRKASADLDRHIAGMWLLLASASAYPHMKPEAARETWRAQERLATPPQPRPLAATVSDLRAAGIRVILRSKE